ncbi:MAG: ribonuclease P protein component [SAR324 cluster bacterium]|nr:ribonuclease P protein component [SAR324 cluster bacterium]
MSGQTFPKAVRLRRRREIRRVFAEGTFRPLGLVSVKSAPTEQESSRFLISIKRKVGTAPERNRIKRLLREAIRFERHRLTHPHDLCFMVTRRPERPVTLDYVQRLIRRYFQELAGKRA